VKTVAGAEGRVLKVTIEYDGGRYRGWQAQVNARTVQGAVLGASRELFGPDTKVQGAGRTDAGVHALGQVASIHLPPGSRPQKLPDVVRRLNELLPFDVNVLGASWAAPAFHARHDAVLRTYRYRLSSRRTAFGKPFLFWVKDPLDVAAMQRAAALFVGLHDFGSFCENPEGHESTLVKVAFSRLEAGPEGSGLLLYRIGGSHFLWKMVRRLVGTLLEVGTSRLGVDGVERLLVERSAEPARWTVPPSGLFLESVQYPGDPPPPAVDPLRPGF